MRAAAKNALSLSLAIAAIAVPSVASAAELELFPRWSIVGADMVAFALLIYPVNRLLIRPLLRLVDEREQRTSGSLDEAGSLERQASELSAQLEAQLGQARERAHARRAAILAAGESEERALLQAAGDDGARQIEAVRAAISADLAEARGALQTDARALAREAAARLLGRAIA